MIDVAIDNELIDFNVCLDERCIKGALDIFNRIEVDIEKNYNFYYLLPEELQKSINPCFAFSFFFIVIFHFQV